jgi:putative heme transporter
VVNPPNTGVSGPKISARRLLVSALILSGFALFVWANRSELPVAERSLRHARLAWIGVGVVGSFALIVNLGGLHRSTQSIAGITFSWKTSIGLAYGVYFLNQIAKSGGMAGAGVFVAHAKRQGKSTGAATAGYLVATVLNQLGFSIALPVGLAIAAHNNRLTRIDWLATSAFACLTVGFLWCVLAATRSQEATRRVFAIPSQLAQRLWSISRHVQTNSAPIESDQQSENRRADDFYATIALLRKNPDHLVVPFCHALLAEGIGVAILWSTLASLGVPGGLEVAVVGYTISMLFSIVGFLPGGLGVVEISLAGSLISMGLPLGKAGAAVAVFRIFELWLPLCIGATCVSHFRKQSPQYPVV